MILAWERNASVTPVSWSDDQQRQLLVSYSQIHIRRSHWFSNFWVSHHYHMMSNTASRKSVTVLTITVEATKLSGEQDSDIAVLVITATVTVAQCKLSLNEWYTASVVLAGFTDCHCWYYIADTTVIVDAAIWDTINATDRTPGCHAMWQKQLQFE